MSRRLKVQQAHIEALRRWPPPMPLLPQGGDRLPRARLAAGQFAKLGVLKLLGIDAARYARELRLGLNDVFALGGGLYAIEVPHDHHGPWTDWLVEWKL